MKKLAIILLISIAGVASNAEEYTIQTISALKEKSITPAFEKKAQKSTLPVTKKKEGVCNILTVGRYESVKKAHADMAKARAIAKDAFIRPVARVIPKACESAHADTRKAAASHPDANATTAVSAKTEGSGEKPKVVSEAQGESAEKAAVPSGATNTAGASVEKGESPDQAERTAIFIYDRNMARKSDIHEAIEYYKNSPYHTFKPIAIQR
jgi:hypothetical protein